MTMERKVQRPSTSMLWCVIKPSVSNNTTWIKTTICLISKATFLSLARAKLTCWTTPQQFSQVKYFKRLMKIVQASKTLCIFRPQTKRLHSISTPQTLRNNSNKRMSKILLRSMNSTHTIQSQQLSLLRTQTVCCLCYQRARRQRSRKTRPSLKTGTTTKSKIPSMMTEETLIQ